VGEGRRGTHGVTAREEAVALPVRYGRKEKGGGDSAWWASSVGLSARGRVGWLDLPGRSGPGGLARPLGRVGPKVEEDLFSDKKN
jgi:hypothetical protein